MIRNPHGKSAGQPVHDTFIKLVRFGLSILDTYIILTQHKSTATPKQNKFHFWEKNSKAQYGPEILKGLTKVLDLELGLVTLTLAWRFGAE